MISDVLSDPNDKGIYTNVKREVQALSLEFPLYPILDHLV